MPPSPVPKVLEDEGSIASVDESARRKRARPLLII